MTSKIILKKSSVAAKVPVVGDLDFGELALNYTDGKLYYKTNAGTVAALNLTATVPDQMVLLDNIASLFNGSLTQFTLKTSSVNFINTELDTEARVIVSVGGTIQAPDPTQAAGFYLTGGTDRTTDPVKITFVEAPRLGQTFFGVVIKSTVSAVVPYTSPSQSIAYAIALG